MILILDEFLFDRWMQNSLRFALIFLSGCFHCFINSAIYGRGYGWRAPLFFLRSRSSKSNWYDISTGKYCHISNHFIFSDAIFYSMFFSWKFFSYNFGNKYFCEFFIKTHSPHDTSLKQVWVQYFKQMNLCIWHDIQNKMLQKG